MSAVAGGITLGAGKVALGQKRKVIATVIPTEGIPSQARQDSLFSYGRAAFEPCVGSVFVAGSPTGRTVNLTLIKVRPYSSKASAKKMTGQSRETDSFSLSFQADGLLPASGIPTLSHPVLGKFALFLTKQSGLFYEAVVNHIV